MKAMQAFNFHQGMVSTLEWMSAYQPIPPTIRHSHLPEKLKRRCRSKIAFSQESNHADPLFYETTA
jgi:hypothetical protein